MKRAVLMSIRPRYVEEILKGMKHFEFRRTVFKHEQVDRVIIYASSPVKKIVAEFDVADIIADSPEFLWEKCKEYSGIDRESFMRYFSNKKKGFSIVIKNLTIYKQPIDPYKRIENFRPPQSYMYLDKKLDEIIKTQQSA